MRNVDLHCFRRYSLAGTSPSCCTGHKSRWMPSTIWTYVLKHSLMAPFPNGCEKTEESDKSDTLRNMLKKYGPLSSRSQLYLGGHLEVDLVLSPLPCDGIVPAANKSKTMSSYTDYIMCLTSICDIRLLVFVSVAVSCTTVPSGALSERNPARCCVPPVITQITDTGRSGASARTHHFSH